MNKRSAVPGFRLAGSGGPVSRRAAAGVKCASPVGQETDPPAKDDRSRLFGIGAAVDENETGCLAQSAFTLLELLLVVGLIAALSGFLIGGLAGGGKVAALQSAQAILANLITAARTKAMAGGQSVRILIQVDATSSSQPPRFLRYVVLQVQTGSGWQSLTDFYLPAGVYVVPGNFSTIPAGLFAAGTSATWTKADGTALRSTALRNTQITGETINGPAPEYWVSIQFSPAGGTAQSQDLIVASGHPRSPGAFGPGESPVELENPASVRGLTLSVYGVPALINDRTGF